MNEKAVEVFISYSTKDTDTAFALLEVLESYGLACWIAPRDIPQGAQWAEEIDKAIQKSKVFVVIISSSSVESRQVPKEIALAVSACDSIYPFRIDNTALQGTFRYYLSEYQFTDAVSDTNKKMTELAQTICSSLGKPVPSKKDPGKRPDPEEKPSPAGNISPPMTPPGKSPRPVMIGVIAAAAVLAVIIGIVLSGKGRETGQGTTAAVDAAQEADTVPSETAPEGASDQDPSLRDGSAMTFGVWKKIAYEDRGAATDVHTDALYILGDGTPYFSLEDSLSGPSRSALTPDLLLEDSGSYDLTVETSFEDTFDGSISDSHGISITSTFAYSGLDIDPDSINPDENPTGLTYSDCYPDQYFFVHLTGTFRESPVKESDVDTWLVYKKQYPLFSSQIYPALVGRWKDSFGNIWEFSMEEEDLAFRMTDTDGNTYAGKECSHRSANEDKVNFFERVQFVFETYKTDFYAVVSFDGQKLEMLDQNWDSFVLTKEP